MISNNTTSEYMNNILNYISGFVQRKIVRFESCAECQSMLQNGLKCSSSFLDLRNEKNPILPEIHINEIVHLTNCVIEDFMEKNNILKEKKLYQKIAHSVIRLIDIKRPDFMNSH